MRYPLLKIEYSTNILMDPLITGRLVGFRLVRWVLTETVLNVVRRASNQACHPCCASLALSRCNRWFHLRIIFTPSLRRDELTPCSNVDWLPPPLAMF